MQLLNPPILPNKFNSEYIFSKYIYIIDGVNKPADSVNKVIFQFLPTSFYCLPCLPPAGLGSFGVSLGQVMTCRNLT